jgi:hypothetical protein
VLVWSAFCYICVDLPRSSFAFSSLRGRAAQRASHHYNPEPMVLLLNADSVEERPPPIATNHGMQRSASTTNHMERHPPGTHDGDSGMKKSRSVIMLPPVNKPMSASEPLLHPIAPKPPAKLVRQFTGVGMTPSFSREDVFANRSAVTLALAAPSDGSTATAGALKAARARRQRLERAERPVKKRGAHVHEPLRTEVPPWLPCWTPKVVEAANTFDRRHRRRWDSAENVYFALSRDLTHLAKQDAFDLATMEIRFNRFSEKESLDGVQRYQMRKKEKVKKPWRLEDSIWAPRVKWCDSKDFYDTDACECKMFSADWKRALDCGIGRYINRLDDGEGDLDEVEEVEKVKAWPGDLSQSPNAHYPCTPLLMRSSADHPCLCPASSPSLAGASFAGAMGIPRPNLRCV